MDKNRSNISGFLADFAGDGILVEVSKHSGRKAATYRLATPTKEGG